MGVGSALGSICASLFAAILAKVAADDVKEVAPRVTGGMLRRVVRLLPKSLQEQCAEEWAAHLGDTPGMFPKIGVLFQLFVAALALREQDARVRHIEWCQARVAATARMIISSIDVALAHEGDWGAFIMAFATSIEATSDLSLIDANKPKYNTTLYGVFVETRAVFRRCLIEADRLPRSLRETGGWIARSTRRRNERGGAVINGSSDRLLSIRAKMQALLD